MSSLGKWFEVTNCWRRKAKKNKPSNTTCNYVVIVPNILPNQRVTIYSTCYQVRHNRIIRARFQTKSKTKRLKAKCSEKHNIWVSMFIFKASSMHVKYQIPKSNKYKHQNLSVDYNLNSPSNGNELKPMRC